MMGESDAQFRKRVIRRSYNISIDNINSTSITNTNNNEQRLIHVRKKPDGLICSICEGPAHGYNFDAITCESCKAFFRRNALRVDEKFKCRSNDGQCIITMATRKRCKACRLAKCFEKGMRADWILTDEERTNKRRKIEENRRLRQMLYPDSPMTTNMQMFEPKTEPNDDDDDDDDEIDDNDDSKDILLLNNGFPLTPSSPTSLLSDKDQTKIDQVQQAYRDSVRLTALPAEIPSYPHIAQISTPWEMVNYPTNILSTRLITYFKLLPEFFNLNENDKLTLIKFNTFALVFIRAALNYDSNTDSYHEQNTNDCVFAGRDLIKCFSLHQYQQSTRAIIAMQNATMRDPVIIRLLLVVMLFSKGSTICTCIDSAEPIANDINALFNAQNIYVELLWKYCEHRFGFRKASVIWIRLVTASMQAHLQAYNTRNDYVKVDTVADQLVPLMRSVMLIS